MSRYRLYIVGCQGRYLRAQDLECATDGEAVQRSQHAVNGHDVEIWEGGRFVARLPGLKLSEPTENHELMARIEALIDRIGQHDPHG